MKKILVFQHADSETLGNLEKEIKLQNLEFEILRTFDHPVFPSGKDLENYGAVISLGGPLAVYEASRHPWMVKELLILKEALRQKKPILGICLGAQLLAAAAGAKVVKGPIKEIGWGWIQFDDWFSRRNPLTFQVDLKKRHRVFQWHGDTFNLPPEGYRLAWNDSYPVQMFSFQGNAIGIQFHVETTEKMIYDWVSDGRDKIVKNGFDPEKILEESVSYLPDLQKMSHKFFYGFASLIRENRRVVA